MTPQPKIYVAGHRGMVGSAIVRQLRAIDCHVAGAPRNDGKGAVIASEARQSMPAASSRIHALGWQAKVGLAEGLTTAYQDFLDSSLRAQRGNLSLTECVGLSNTLTFS